MLNLGFGGQHGRRLLTSGVTGPRSQLRRRRYSSRTPLRSSGAGLIFWRPGGSMNACGRRGRVRVRCRRANRGSGAMWDDV